MKWMIASDIHGSASCCRRLLEAWDREGAGRLLLLGDILYHGPRNDLPEAYAPKEVIAMLNERADRIYSVRGNCEAEVDQMVLRFPVMADYCLLPLADRMIVATHGHIYHEGALPPMQPGDALLYGHTHVLRAQRSGDYFFLNPGSVSIPKENNPRSYAVLEGDTFTVRELDGREICHIRLAE